MVIYLSPYLELLHWDERIKADVRGAHIKAVLNDNGEIERVEHFNPIKVARVNYWPEDIAPDIKDQIKYYFDYINEHKHEAMSDGYEI